jgi:organic hydroperoxide reductase OsmC/OhrA
MYLATGGGRAGTKQLLTSPQPEWVRRDVGIALASENGMHPFPHRYVVTALAETDSDILMESPGLPTLTTRPPAEFDGPGDAWSPETLFVAAVADCYALTMRGIARRSKLPWLALECQVAGTLNRVDDVTRFTEIHIHARLRVPEGTSVDLAARVLAKAEHACLVTRSLNATTVLTTAVEAVTTAAA